MNKFTLLTKTHYKKIIQLIFVLIGAITITISSCTENKLSKPNPDLPIQIYFTPWDNAEQAIINAIESAQKSIYIQAYVWTSKPLTQSIIQAKKKGVMVYILCDKNQMINSKSSQIPTLAKYAIPIKLEVKYQNAHNKVMIIDYNTRNSQVITGSYNFSYSAEHRNSENLLIIRDQKIAQSYYENWQKHNNDAIMY